MKYEVYAGLIYIVNNEDKRILFRDPNKTQWHTHSSCEADLFELQDAIRFAIDTPYNPLASKLKAAQDAPIGTRAEGINGNPSFFLKVATDKWYFYSSIDLENPYTLVDGNTATYTDNALATMYSHNYPIQENA